MVLETLMPMLNYSWIILRTFVLPAIKYILLVFFTILASVNLATAFASLKKEEEYEQQFPTVSVVVRCWNDSSVVERCILNFLGQEYPKKDIEIIIVDDGSTDDTEQVCKKYEKEGKIKYVRYPTHFEFKADAIDPVIKNAMGEIILETDVDFVLPKNWVREMVKPFSDERVKAVTGRVMCGNWYRTWLTHIRAIEDFWHFCTAMFGRYNLTGHGTLYGSSKAYRKSVWDEVGGHPKIIVEDAGLLAEISSRNYKIVNVKAANLAEEVEDINQYIAERKRWAGGNFETFSRYKNRLSTSYFGTLVLISNFSIDAVIIIPMIMMFFERLFFIPIFMSLLAIWIGLQAAEAKEIFYLWAVVYLVMGPLLQTIALLGAFKDKFIKGRLFWEKVWHYPTKLVWPTK